MRHSLTLPLFAVAMSIGLTACGKAPESATAATESPVRISASIQEVMNSLVDPAADGIWDTFSTTVSKSGVEIKQPANEEEWTTVRHQAITLVEASNLLVLDGRKVAHEGKKLDDTGTPGLLSSEEIGKAIAADRAGFVSAAHRLQDAGLAVLAAIDARKPEAVVEAGGKIDGACEACHVKFWYPNAQAPKPERFPHSAAVAIGVKP